ncbi:MAG: peptidoglycan bridge formation glycyltransferase FemA/FemB family protein [Anaerolineae bacterium]|nr:peptidoglycan bridge formation glycyltransferase FemA/FemB family protein [Anaerolineae bacterium]
MLKFKTINHRDTWDRALISLPNAHPLQTWDWGEFKSHWGWTVQRRLWLKQDAPVAAAQILQRRIPYTPWNFLYIPKGPALDYTDVELTDSILADLERYARQVHSLFIKIDPDVPRQFGEPQLNQPPLPAGQAVLDLLTRRGWTFSSEQIQFRNTVVIDLTPSPDDLLAAMKSKWRYNIRLAERKGVSIRPGSIQDLGIFYRMYAETATRDGFLIRPEAYYRDVWQCFLEAGRAEMLLAVVEKEIAAGLVLFVCGQTAWYMYGASTGQHRPLMPNYLLQWAAMRRAKERGCTRYDLWGAPDVFDETDGMWGVYRFKQGFGGQVVQGLGAFDYPANKPFYWAFTAALPRLRKLMRRLRR